MIMNILRKIPLVASVLLAAGAINATGVRGDANGNGVVDIDDLNLVINVMLGKSGAATPAATVTHQVGDVSFKMVLVAPGSFVMGATEDDTDAMPMEKPAHQVTLTKSYYLGETEVTQALWLAVMGENPSHYSSRHNYVDDFQRPVEAVSWNNCQTFIAKLNQMTGQNFRLPTEAEWEYAARGGNKSKGYKYPGSDNIDEVAWYYDNLPALYEGATSDGVQPVATKRPNELGLYDMAGNASEYCQDYYGNYTADPLANPTGPASGSFIVRKGGCFNSRESGCRPSGRGGVSCDETERWYGLGLRLAQAMAQSEASGDVNNDGVVDIDDVNLVINVMLHKDMGGVSTFTVGDVTFDMVAVEGGAFTMGATAEQGDKAWENEKPAHEVTLSPYKIGATEVTQALWVAVMGSNPSRWTGDLNRPVERVSWNDCQEFITKLNALTGQRFRLPTEAEWEYAARGGGQGEAFMYAGSNNLGQVGWYKGVTTMVHAVGTLKPNALGLYDMSGNVWEWCADWYLPYTGGADPTSKVFRGGSFTSGDQYCRVTARFSNAPTYSHHDQGLRLAM